MADDSGQDVQIVGAPHIAYHSAEGHIVHDVLEVFRDEGVAGFILVSDGLENIVPGLAGTKGRSLDDVGSDGGQGDAGGVALHTDFFLSGFQCFPSLSVFIIARFVLNVKLRFC